MQNQHSSSSSSSDASAKDKISTSKPSSTNSTNSKNDNNNNPSKTTTSSTEVDPASLEGAPFDINARDSKGLSLLFVASVLGYEAPIKKLVSSGADVSIFIKNDIDILRKEYLWKLNDIIDNSGNTALAAASLLGHTNIVSYLLSEGADCNLANGDGYTPLYLASKGGYTDIVSRLLDAGAEVNVRTEEEGDTALHISCLKGHEEISYTYI